MTTTPPTTLQTRVQEIVEEVIASTDVFLVEVLVRGRQGSRVVEVYVDSEEGVGIGKLAALSREIGFLFETEDVVKGHYNLNVSSPGTDRPLKFIRQYPKHIGRTLSVTYRDTSESENDESGTVKGELVAVADQAVILKTSRTPELRIPFEAIEHAKVVLPW